MDISVIPFKVLQLKKTLPDTEFKTLQKTRNRVKFEQSRLGVNKPFLKKARYFWLCWPRGLCRYHSALMVQKQP